MDEPVIRENRYAGIRYHTKVHSFRIGTAILAWFLIGLAFYYHVDHVGGDLRSFGPATVRCYGEGLK